jgi:hypothetical protein
LKRSDRHLAVATIVALAVLFGGLPIVASQAAPDSYPAFTLDICHPLQAVNAVSAPCNPPVLRANVIAHPPAPAGVLTEVIVTAAARPADAPDPPPPKAIA